MKWTRSPVVTILVASTLIGLAYMALPYVASWMLGQHAHLCRCGDRMPLHEVTGSEEAYRGR